MVKSYAREWIGRPPSTGLPATSCDNLENSYTLVEHGGMQGMDRAVTTCPPTP